MLGLTGFGGKAILLRGPSFCRMPGKSGGASWPLNLHPVLSPNTWARNTTDPHVPPGTPNNQGGPEQSKAPVYNSQGVQECLSPKSGPGAIPLGLVT